MRTIKNRYLYKCTCSAEQYKYSDEEVCYCKCNLAMIKTNQLFPGYKNKSCDKKK